VAHGALLFLDKRLPSRGQQGEVVLRETNGSPFQRGWKAFFHFSAKGRVWIDADSFAAQVRHSPFGWTTATFRLEVAMIRSQIDTEAPIQEQIEECVQVRLLGPLAHLVVHPGGAHFHPVHDLVDLVHDQPGDSCPGMRKRFGNGFQITVAQPLDVDDLVWRETLIRPELRP